LHLESVRELQHVRHSSTCDFRRFEVDEVEQIDEFLKRNVLDLNFFFSLFCGIMEEHCSEDGRMISKD
ncbi:hypothetical protein PMAYCL1PPCAC_25978, partial [Pristionchus mayeri]